MTLMLSELLNAARNLARQIDEIRPYPFFLSFEAGFRIEEVNRMSDGFDDYLYELKRGLYAQVDRVDIIPYSNDNEPRADQLVFMLVSELPLLQEIVNEINQNQTNIGVVDSLENAVEKFDVFSIKLLNGDGRNDRPINVFYTLARKKVIKKRFIVANGGNADVTEKVLTQAPSEDDWLFIAYGDVVIISHKGLAFLNKASNLRAVFEAKAKGLLAKLKLLDLIDDFDSFESACLNDFRIIRRLCNVAEQNYLNSLSIVNVLSLKQSHSLDKITIRDNKIVYSSDARWEIIKILNDDLLKSARTNANYVANAKDSV